MRRNLASVRRLLQDPFARLVAGVALLGLVYMLAVPPNGGVDEQDHLVRAAATVRGDLVGRGYRFPGDQIRVYDVDIRFKGPHNACWARNPEQDASCMDFTVDPAEQPFALNGYYPPTYFAAVGWPSLVVHGYAAVRPVRLVSCVVSLAMIAFGLTMFRRRWGDRGAVVAVMAVTPTVLFLTGTVNPHAFEVAAAFAVWAALPSVLEGEVRRAETVGFVASALALVTVRPLGPVFWFVALGVVAVAGEDSLVAMLRRVWRNRAAVAVSVVAAGTAIASLAAGVGSLENDDYARPVSVLDAAGTAVLDQLRWYHDAVGRLGWLDITPPAITQWVWSALLAAALVAVCTGPRRARLALAVLAAALYTVQLYTIRTQTALNGLNWQGRYGLALMVGLVTVALTAAGARLAAVRWLPVVVGAVCIAQFVSLYLALRRWTVGTNGPLWYAFDTNWSPPLPAWMLLAAGLAGVLGVASAGYQVGRAA